MDEKILIHLSKDKQLAPVLETVIIATQTTFGGDLYFDLIRSIVSQQLSVKAAASIFKRFLASFPGNYPHIEDLLRMEIEDLRALGLSKQKSTYVQCVAEFFKEHSADPSAWADKTDEEIIQSLTAIKGVGKWTAQMILMFTLERPDILPVDDLGIQKGMIKLYDIETKGKELKQEMERYAEPWRPYRTYACRYIWNWITPFEGEKVL